MRDIAPVILLLSNHWTQGGMMAHRGNGRHYCMLGAMGEVWHQTPYWLDGPYPSPQDRAHLTGDAAEDYDTAVAVAEVILRRFSTWAHEQTTGIPAHPWVIPLDEAWAAGAVSPYVVLYLFNDDPRRTEEQVLDVLREVSE